jgi:hypothetical protein
MRRAARPATVVMGAKLVQVRGTDSTDMQPGLSAHSRDKDRRWQGKGCRGILRRPGHQKMEHSLRRNCAMKSSLHMLLRDSEALRAVGCQIVPSAVCRVAAFTAWRYPWWSWWSRERLFGKNSYWHGASSVSSADSDATVGLASNFTVDVPFHVIASI